MIMKLKTKLLCKYQNQSIYTYELINSKGLSCTISNYGATILSLSFKTLDGKLKNIALGFKNFDTYIHNSLYAGASLGPNAGRLSYGKLPLESRIYDLCKNDNNHNIHGGFNNISFQVWNYENEVIEENSASLTLSLNMDHGLDGFPGNRRIKATFSLNHNNELKIKYEGESHRDTYLNLSNHCYFNLSGDFSTSILHHKLSIAASNYLENTEEHCAYKLSPVDNSPFDFRKPETLKSHLESYPEHPQLALGRGYNNGFCLDSNLSINKPALILESSDSSVTLELYTDAPSIVLYSGGYIEEGLLLNDDSLSKPSCALAIEPQDYPNGPNLPFVETKILRKGEKYERNITYKFRMPF